MRSASMIGIRSWFYEAEYPLAKAVTPSACTRFLSLSIFKPIWYLFTVYNHVLCILYILSNKQVLQSTNVRLSMITHFFVPLQHSSSNILSIFLHAYISVLYATNTTIIFPPSYLSSSVKPSYSVLSVVTFYQSLNICFYQTSPLHLLQCLSKNLCLIKKAACIHIA